MAIDIEREELIHFPEATKAIPGRNVNLATLHRWRLKGVGTPPVKIDSCVVGGLRYTSREAIARFCAAQNAPKDPAQAGCRTSFHEAATNRHYASVVPQGLPEGPEGSFKRCLPLHPILEIDRHIASMPVPNRQDEGNSVATRRASIILSIVAR